jgi:hypothetical protein
VPVMFLIESKPENATSFTQGGRVFDSVGIKIKGGRERKEGK